MTLRPSRLLPFLLLTLALLVGVAGRAQARTGDEPPTSYDVSVVKIHYISHNGLRRVAYVLLPAWLDRDDRPLPLVIAPHGRGVHPLSAVEDWSDLPSRGGFAVVIPAGQGRRLEYYSWGYAGQIADLARMPSIVTRALPWLRIDRRRVFAIGTSMGGQESLLLLGRHPESVAGVAAFDAAADMRLRYDDFPSLSCDSRCRHGWIGPIGRALQALARLEIGGTPTSEPRAYAARSPLTWARAIAFSGRPVQLWWSWDDRTVTQQDRQSGRLYRRLRELNPRAPVEAFAGWWEHGSEQRSYLRIALADFGLLSPVYGDRPAGVEFMPPPTWPTLSG
jgi:poly(3-hydroxybutyrate) depolymerase